MAIKTESGQSFGMIESGGYSIDFDSGRIEYGVTSPQYPCNGPEYAQQNAWVQDPSINQRLDRLEEQLNRIEQKIDSQIA